MEWDWEIISALLIGGTIGYVAGFLKALIGVLKACKRIEWKDGKVTESKWQ